MDRAELHEALLRLGGQVPDDVLVQARLRLADRQLDRAPEPSLPGAEYVFVPAPTGTAGGGAPGVPVLDLTGWVSTQDNADRAAVLAASAVPGAIALWRSWRIPHVVAPNAGPARVYVLAADTGLPAATAAVMRGLVDAGVPEPQVQTYRPGDPLPVYTRAARQSSALLWSAAGAAPLRVARIFDAAGGFTPGHERLTGTDRAHTLAYLQSGSVVLATTARDGDVVDPERGEVVPLDYRTDGRWIWTDTVTYYLREHDLAPEPELLSDIRAAGALLPATDAVDEHRALAALFQSGALVRAEDS